MYVYIGSAYRAQVIRLLWQIILPGGQSAKNSCLLGAQLEMGHHLSHNSFPKAEGNIVGEGMERIKRQRFGEGVKNLSSGHDRSDALMNSQQV